MSSIAAEILALPGQAVGAGLHTVSPQVRAPRQPGGFYLTAGGIEIQFISALDLFLDKPFYGESGLVSMRLGIERCTGIAAVDAA